MDEVFDLCMRTPPLFNKDMFIFWLEGRSVVDGKIALLKQNKDCNTKTLSFRPKTKGGKNIEMNVNELLMAEIADQYKTYSLLQHYIHEPSLFVNQGRYN